MLLIYFLSPERCFTIQFLSEIHRREEAEAATVDVNLRFPGNCIFSDISDVRNNWSLTTRHPTEHRRCAHAVLMLRRRRGR